MVHLAILATIVLAFVGKSSQFECKYDEGIIGKQQAIFDAALSQPLVSRVETVYFRDMDYYNLAYDDYDYRDFLRFYGEPLEPNCEWK